MWFLTAGLSILCVFAACNTDTTDGWTEQGSASDSSEGSSGGSSSTTGTTGVLFDFDVTWDDVSDANFTDAEETVITDKTNEEYDDFVENSSFGTTIQLTYADGTVTVTGEAEGVTVTSSGADVTVNSSVAGIEYVLAGTTSDGSFKIYSDKKFKLTLNALSLASAKGAAINVQSAKRVFVVVKDGTENTLADAVSYTNLVDGEDQKACLFSEGQLIFSGTGVLNVKGNNRHAICSDDYVRLRSGSRINITSAVKDGIHANENVIMGGGRLLIAATGDGVDSEGSIEVRGGLLKANTGGDSSKAMKADGDITLSGGQLILLTTGAAVYEDSDISSSAGINCDGNLVMKGTAVSVKSTGLAGKGISCDGALTADNSLIKVVTTGKQYVYGSLDSSAKGIKADGDLTINSGTVWVKTTGGEGSEGIESKSRLVINGGDVNVYAYDDGMNASSHIEINGGNVYVYSNTNDGIDSNGTLTMTGGVLIAVGSTSPEGGIDSDQNTFKITGGTLLGIGGSSSTPTASASTQRSVIYGGSGSAGTLLSIAAASGTHVMSYVIPKTYSQMSVLFSSDKLVSGTNYLIYTGGNVSGGDAFYGLTTGGTYQSGTSVSSFTPSSMVTTTGSSSGGFGGGGRR